MTELRERLARVAYQAMAGRPNTLITAPSAMRAVEAILTELETAGWCLVPDEPTKAMVSAGIAERHEQPCPEAWNLATSHIYTAMLRARPKI